MAKIALYQTFYEYLLTFPLTRYEITSSSCKEIVFFDKTLEDILKRKDLLMEKYQAKLEELNLDRFRFLYHLSSADEDFGKKLFTYCSSKIHAVQSYDTVC